ncbi:Holliday junction DNA helicase RuvA [bacterium]|nr:Holliday junction DNA helicase RuvA [bacterium]
MITRVTGTLEVLGTEEALIAIGPIQTGISISEETRTKLQSQLGEQVTLYTIFDIEGGVGGSRMTPRLIGFLSPVDREFFEVFTSVDGVGVRKALRAMTRSVRDLARMIQDQDVKGLSTLPGIGEAFAERIVAKLRRKVATFALGSGDSDGGSKSSGKIANVSDQIIDDAFQVLISFGHADSDARRMIETALAEGTSFGSAADLLATIYGAEARPGAKPKTPKGRK